MTVIFTLLFTPKGKIEIFSKGNVPNSAVNNQNRRQWRRQTRPARAVNTAESLASHNQLFATLPNITLLWQHTSTNL